MLFRSDEMVASSKIFVPNEVRDAILESDAGPQILYHLASLDETDAENFSKMSTTQALKMIGKLEARFEKTEPKSEPVAVKSKAPAPISPLKGSSNVDAEARLGSDGQYHGTYAQWKADRKAGKIR